MSGAPQPRHRVLTLMAIVTLFIVCNIPKMVINLWDMFEYKRIVACRLFNSNRNFGYSQTNETFSRIGKESRKKNENRLISIVSNLIKVVFIFIAVDDFVKKKLDQNNFGKNKSMSKKLLTKKWWIQKKIQ